MSYYELAASVPTVVLAMDIQHHKFITLCYHAFCSVYNLLFHPLRSYPGPWYSRVSRLWYFIRALQGILPYEVKKLHDRYGPVVRIASNELSYNCPEAWQDIYGRNAKPNSTEYQLLDKDPTFYGSFLDQKKTMVDAQNQPYKDQRKPLSHAFSRAAVVDKQDVLSKYHRLMSQALKSYISNTKEDPVDVSIWISNALLDITTTLTIDRGHGGVEMNNKLHPALATLNSTMDFLWKFLQFQRLPKLINWSIQKFIAAVLGHFKFFERNNHSSHLIKDRLQDKSPHSDYMHYLLQSPEHANGIQLDSLFPKASFLLLSGTETTATAVSGMIYNLCANQQTFKRAAEEVRSAFHTTDDINIDTTQNLTYLKNCIRESQRMYPSTPGTFPRCVPQTGANICGQLVPGNTIVGIPHFAAFRSSDNFSDPDKFLPERWSGESSDKRGALQPFSFGPRVCIAKELAMRNMELIMARLLWEFDMELNPKSKNWNIQKTGLFPKRGPLYVKVKSRHELAA